MRYVFISAEKANYPLILLCRVMKVASSGYYAWLAAGKTRREQENEKLIPLVREILCQMVLLVSAFRPPVSETPAKSGRFGPKQVAGLLRNGWPV